jgi:hypothetical protein
MENKYRNATILDKIGSALGDDGVKMDIGLDAQTMILMPILIMGAIVGGILLAGWIKKAANLKI